jgi:hypothetical protein
MMQKPAIYGMNRKRKRMVEHMSAPQKRLAIIDLVVDLKVLAAKKQDAILNKNIDRWDDWIFRRRTDKIDATFREVLAYHGAVHKEYEDAHLEDTCSPISRECAV